MDKSKLKGLVQTNDDNYPAFHEYLKKVRSPLNKVHDIAFPNVMRISSHYDKETIYSLRK